VTYNICFHQLSYVGENPQIEVQPSHRRVENNLKAVQKKKILYCVRKLLFNIILDERERFENDEVTRCYST